jgi:hypothetical protein
MATAPSLGYPLKFAKRVLAILYEIIRNTSGVAETLLNRSGCCVQFPSCLQMFLCEEENPQEKASRK